MKTYRGIVVVSHHDEQIGVAELIKHLAQAVSMEIESTVDGLQVVILWRSLVDVDDPE